VSCSIYRGKLIGDPSEAFPEASTDFTKCRCEQTPFELLSQALQELKDGKREIHLDLGHPSGKSIFIGCGPANDDAGSGFWVNIWDDGTFEIGEPAA